MRLILRIILLALTILTGIHWFTAGFSYFALPVTLIASWLVLGIVFEHRLKVSAPLVIFGVEPFADDSEAPAWRVLRIIYAFAGVFILGIGGLIGLSIYDWGGGIYLTFTPALVWSQASWFVVAFIATIVFIWQRGLVLTRDDRAQRMKMWAKDQAS